MIFFCYLSSSSLTIRIIENGDELSIESELARKIDFSNLIKAFVHQKARKAMLK